MPGEGWPNAAAYRFVRLFRTPSSEIYLIWDGQERVGQADLHYNEALRLASLTLVLESSLSQDDIEELVGLIDHDLISSHLSDIEREDLSVTVFQGEETAAYHLTADEDSEFWGWLGGDEEGWDTDNGGDSGLGD